MQETWVQSLGWEGPLEKGKATHSSILAWRTPRTEEPGSSLSLYVCVCVCVSLYMQCLYFHQQYQVIKEVHF